MRVEYVLWFLEEEGSSDLKKVVFLTAVHLTKGVTAKWIQNIREERNQRRGNMLLADSLRFVLCCMCGIFFEI